MKASVIIPGTAARLLRMSTLSALALVPLAGCAAVGPDFHTPAPAASAGFAGQPLGDAGPGAPSQHADPTAQLPPDWWRLFKSAKLDDLVQQALSNNWTLSERKAALAHSREQVVAARGALYPSLDVGTSVMHTKIGAEAFGPDAQSFPIFGAYGAGAQVSYDTDIFGQNRRRIEQATALAQNQGFELQAATLALASNVAIQAMQIATLQRRLEILATIISDDGENLRLVNGAVAAGAATRADVLQAQAQLDRDRAMVPAIRQELSAAQDALAILVGKSPADWTPPALELTDFALPETTPTTVPSKIVRDRPDIRAAEARLHAASAAIGVATADLYPKLTLSASVAEQGLISGPAGPAWTILGGLAAPVFHGGQLKAAQRAAKDDYTASLAAYQQVVISALSQVADQLHALGNDADGYAADTQALASARGSLDLARGGYRAGAIGVVQLLEAQRLTREAELEQVQAVGRRYTDTVKLFLAVGPAHPPTADALAMR
jgi:NodT family efflux transporter outer membrane factor (OMF) lipoprotein